MSDHKPITWTHTEERSGLLLIDRIDRCRCALYTPSQPAPTPGSTEQFNYPVDSALTINTAQITMPVITGVNLRDENGRVLTRIEASAEQSYPRDQYVLELSAPIKTYLAVDSSVHLAADTTRTRIEFGGETTVTRVRLRRG